MSRTLLVSLALAAALAFAPRGARACGSGYGGAGLAIALFASAGVGVVDTGFLISDGVIASWGEVPSVGHGIGEMIFALPTTALGLGLFAAGGGGSDSGGYYVISGLITVVGIGMGAHAIWTFASQPESPSRPPSSFDNPPASRGTALRRTRQIFSAPVEAPLPAAQLAVVPTMLPLREYADARYAPGVGATLRF